MDRSFEIPENDRHKMLQALGLKPYDASGNENPLPEPVEDMYRRYKRVLDRLVGGYVPDIALAMICTLAGAGKTETKEEVLARESVIAAWDREDVRYGDRVTVKWRGKETDGVLHGITADRKNAIVQVGSNPQDREIPVADVWVSQSREPASV